ncbi:MAG: 6-bladed beta-propeller [Mediterranea sp.]|jgi:hypothetical protein|nr:6-bladed beta-propeller [Mediterranea sp.]
MKTITPIIFILFALSVSCGKENAPFVRVPLDGDTKQTLNLSDIVSEMNVIKLETTDLSLINIRRFRRAIFNQDYILIAQTDKVFLFDGKGKFLRTIGKKGNGPGEYQFIAATSFDFQKGLIYIQSAKHLLCYDINGKFIESFYIEEKMPKDIYFNADKHCMLAETRTSEKGKPVRNLWLYQFDAAFNKVDSVLYRSISSGMALWTQPYTDSFTQLDNQLHLYCFEGDEEALFRDTLYRIADKQLMPALKLDIKNAEASNGERTLYLLNIYRSSRYVFAVCYRSYEEQKNWFYCYDTKEKKAYFQGGGFTDDIYQTGEPAAIRVLQTDANCIYYLSPDKEDDEANYQLCFGRLKD